MAYRPPKRIAKLDTISTEDDYDLFDPANSANWALPIDSLLPESEDKGTVKVPMNRIALLDSNGKVPGSMLPGYVDDMAIGTMSHTTDPDEHWSFDDPVAHVVYGCPTQLEGEIPPLASLIYHDTPTGVEYRYAGNMFCEIPNSLLLVEGSCISITNSASTRAVSLKIKPTGNYAPALGADNDGLLHDTFAESLMPPETPDNVNIFPIDPSNTIRFGENFNTHLIAVNRTGHVTTRDTALVYMPAISGGHAISIDTDSNGNKTIHIDLKYPSASGDPDSRALSIENDKLLHIEYASSIMNPSTADNTFIPVLANNTKLSFGSSFNLTGLDINRTGHVVASSTTNIYLPQIVPGTGLNQTVNSSGDRTLYLDIKQADSTRQNSMYLMVTTDNSYISYIELGKNFWESFYVVKGNHNTSEGSTLYVKGDMIGNLRSDGTLRSATTDTSSAGYYIGAAYIAAGTASPVGLVLTTGSNHYIEPSSIYFTTNSDGLLSSRGYWATPNMYINTATAYVTSHATSTSNTNTYLCFNSGTGNALSSVNIIGNNGVTVSSKATSGDKNSVLTISGETSHIPHYGQSGYDWSQLNTLAALVAVHGYGTSGFSVYTRSNFGGTGGPWTWDDNDIYSRNRIISRVQQNTEITTVPLPWIPTFAKYDTSSSSTLGSIYYNNIDILPSSYCSSYVSGYVSTISVTNGYTSGKSILCVPPYHKGICCLTFTGSTNASVSGTTWFDICLSTSRDQDISGMTVWGKNHLWGGYGRWFNSTLMDYKSATFMFLNDTASSQYITCLVSGPSNADSYTVYKQFEMTPLDTTVTNLNLLA